MTAGLRIWLLGTFRAAGADGPVPAGTWQRNRAKAVVKLLALAPGHRMHREQMMETLWPGLPASHAATNLRKAMHFARQALDSDRLLLRDDVLSLDGSPLWVDVDAFETAANSGDAATAIDLYAGDLLLEDRFEPWTGERREQLRARFTRLLRERATEMADAGDGRAAVALLERLAALDPLDEQAVAGLMRVTAAAGQRHLALRWYDQFATRLDDELGVAPGPATSRLRGEIASGRFPEAAPAGPPVTAPAGSPTDEAGIPPYDERKLVTALLADVAAAPAAADPERIKADLDACTRVVVESCESWGASVERLVGGSVLAVFGLPRVREDDAGRALRAALEVLQDAPLSLRIGVATGEVIAPAGPRPNPREVAGYALDAAARLRDAAAPGTAVAAERTRHAAGGGFRFGPPVRVTGAGRPAVDGLPLVGLSGDTAPARPRDLAPMVGRDAELHVMLHLFEEAVESGMPRLATVVGAAGVGKSRIVQEAVGAMCSRRAGTVVLRGRCLSAGRGVTYWSLGEILREACAISLSDPPEVAATKCWDGLRAILGRVDQPVALDTTVYALAATCGVSLPGNPLDRQEPMAVADELSRAWPRFATACAVAGPAVIVIEDLHWAGEELLGTLELMVARSSGQLLVVATARPELAELHPTFGAGRDGFASIVLRPLTPAHSRSLLDSLAPARRLPPALRDGVLTRSEGNPFFLEELVLHLSRARPAEPAVPQALPDSVHTLLAARIDGLPPAEKRTLQRAAVIGRIFWAEPVTRALGAEVADAALRGLEQRGFVVRRPESALGGQAEYGFRHGLTHEVAYASTATADRARAHSDVGAWIEERSAGREDEVAELLAYHFAAAVGADAAELAWPDPAERERVRERAFGHLCRAGTTARRRSALPTAAGLHQRALALAATDSERWAVLEELGDDGEASYRGDDALDRYRQALALVRAGAGGADDHSRLCRKAAWLLTSAPGSFRVSPDPAVAEEFIAEGRTAGADPVSTAWLLVVRGMSARLWRGSEPFGQGTEPDPDPIGERIQGVEQAMALGSDRQLSDLVKAATSTLSVLYGIAGRYADAVAHARRELAALADTGSRSEQADTVRTAAVLTVTISGRFTEGLELAQRCRTLAADSANPHQTMHAIWPVLAALFHLGRWDELLPVLDEHLAAFARAPATGCQFVRDGPLIGATVAAYRGDPGRARALAALVADRPAEPERASDWDARLALATGDAAAARRVSAAKAREGRMYGPQHAFTLLEALLADGDRDGAGEFLPTARANIAGNALLGPACERADGLLHAAEGLPAQAVRALRRALSGFERLGVAFEAARTREHLAGVSPADARSLLAAALATYERLGAAPHARAVRARLDAA